MIYILAGNDSKNRSKYIKDLTKGAESIFLTQSNISKQLLNSYAMNNPLFGNHPAIIIENINKLNDLNLPSKFFSNLKESKTMFIFLEDKLLVADERKYKKFAKIEKFVDKTIKKISNNNLFDITDAFANKNKIKTWVLFREAIERGVSPESISGILFWKIKTMILNKSKFFDLKKLKDQSSSIVSLHHKAHRGEVDFIIGLEQFILESLA